MIDGETVYSVYILAGQLVLRDNITTGICVDVGRRYGRIAMTFVVQDPSVAKAHASKGTNRYSKSKPKTGRFNARARAGP